MADEITNAVTRLYACAQGRDWVETSFDAFADIHAADVVVEARTHAGQRYEVRGRDEAMREARSLSDVGLRHVTMEPLEVRGDRLALIRWLNWSDDTDLGGGPANVDQVGVAELDEVGKVRRVVIFDMEDLELARAEPDARAATLEPTD